MFGVREPMPGVVYPDPKRLRAYVESGVLRQTTLAEELQRSFARHARRVALYTDEGELTYAELDDATNRFALALHRLGLAARDRVLFQSNNSRELILAFVGCLKAGVIPICTLAQHREKEIGYLGCHADARAHLVDGADPKFDLQAFALDMKPRIPTVGHVIALRGAPREGVLCFAELVASADPVEAREFVARAERDPFQVCVFQLSGGTTDVPKIIPRMSNDYLLNATATAEWLGFRPEDVIFMPMPIIHNACMVCFLLPCLLTGAAFCVPADMTPEAWGDVFTRARPTFLGLIRPLFPRYEAMVERGLGHSDRVRACWSPDGAREFRERYGVLTYGMFGMTEGLCMYTRADDPVEARDYTVGTPLTPLDEARLVAPGTEDEVAIGEVGELLARGPYTLAGYYNAPARNREAFTADGFYRTGDLLLKRVIEGKVFYTFAGRTKDIVNRGHEKVNCEELEKHVGAHPAVAAVAVVGMPDPVLGERICAYVVARDGHPPPTVATLGHHLRALGVATFKWPERVEVVDALSVTKVGKLDRAAMRRDLVAKLSGESSSLGLAGVHHSARPTWKLRETIEFYRDVLGLPLVHAVSARGWGRKAHPDFLHFFFESGKGSTIAFFYYLGTEQPDHLRHRAEYDSDAVHTAWQVGSRAELLSWRRRLEERGVKILYQLQHEVIESIYFRDPNGYYLEITLPLRPLAGLDASDAERTLAEAMTLEDQRALPDITAVWRAKGARLAAKERSGDLVVFVPDLPELDPLRIAAARAPGCAVTGPVDGYWHVRGADEIRFVRRELGLAPALWNSALSGGYVGRIVEYGQDVLRLAREGGST